MLRSAGAPAMPLLIGVLSSSLLLWTRRIHERSEARLAYANVVMDFRIRAATSHLWSETALASEAEKSRALSDLREVTRLSGVLLAGGASEDGLVALQPEDPEVIRHAEGLARVVAELGSIVRERFGGPDHGPEASALEARGDQVAGEIQRRAADLERVIATAHSADTRRSRGLFDALFAAWAGIVGASTFALLARERRRSDAERALQSRKEELEASVSERTRDLRCVNDQLSLELAERDKTEQALRESEARLRHLSARILTAQETEQRRISRELHDDIGHSLVILKLQIGLMSRELPEDQAAVKEECAVLSDFIDRTLEDVRRLSRDLRPGVVEALGLSAALRSLVHHHGGANGYAVVTSIGEVDGLVSRETEVAMYRIVQQALANAATHAHAQRVSLSVEGGGEQVRIVVEDDGEGFDLHEVQAREPSHPGLGLATMQERAWMVGGALQIWSEKGKGTRITLRVPVHERKG